MPRAASRRLKQELLDMKVSGQTTFRSIELINGDEFKWQGLIAVDTPPYSKGFFLINISFPTGYPAYPFKPPVITFLTKIYHPNISEEGEVRLPIIDPAYWKPATRTAHVICALDALITHPEPRDPLRSDLAASYRKNKKEFFKTAEEHTLKHAITR